MSGLRSLAELMAEHEGQEPARASAGFYDGLAVVIKCVLQRTVVAILPNEDEPRVIRIDRITMDPDRIRWVKRSPIDWVGNEKHMWNRQPRRKTA